MDPISYKTKPIAELLAMANPDNPNVAGDADMQRLVMSISEYGFLVPVVINTRFTRIVGGHHRIEAAASLGYTELPYIETDLDEEREAACGLALNASYGRFDDERLSAMLRKLQAKRFDLDLTGLPPYDIEAVMAQLPPVFPSAPPAEPSADRAFRVQYKVEDEDAIASFLGHSSLPDKKLLGALMIGRIRALAQGEV